MTIDITAITATWQRPQLLALCLWQFRQQELGGLRCEHLVISDGPDARARATAEYHGARYLELDRNYGLWGATCNDAGVVAARGEYVVFWNDDNVYYPHALASLFAASRGVDIGVCQTVHWSKTRHRILPLNWSGQLQLGHVDTMCVCVHRELARQELWAVEPVPYEVDFGWLTRLQQRGATVSFSPVVIGEHL
ncbi:MAG: glycosyltransferase [Planctomycetaceae bacterium]